MPDHGVPEDFTPRIAEVGVGAFQAHDAKLGELDTVAPAVAVPYTKSIWLVVS